MSGERKGLWRDIAERATKAGLWAIAGIGAGLSSGASVDWKQAALMVIAAVCASLVGSLASAQVGDPGTASVIRRPDVALPPIVGEFRDVAVQQVPNVVRSMTESATSAWEKTMRGGDGTS